MLDARLQAVADFVSPDAGVADIGTDHAYLAIALYQANSNRKIIAADLNQGPCEAARRTIREAGIDEIEVRQGDGLAALKPGEVEAVCIAGMGGKLEADILTAHPKIVESLRCIIVQPQNGQDYLRKWLYDHKWHIADEQLAKVDGRIYQIIKAVPGAKAMPSEAELVLGPVLLSNKVPLLLEHIEGNVAVLQNIADGLSKGGDKTAGKLAEIQRKISLLEDYLP